MTMHFIHRGGTWLHKGNATFAEFGAMTLLLLSLALYPYVPENWSYQLFSLLLVLCCWQFSAFSEVGCQNRFF